MGVSIRRALGWICDYSLQPLLRYVYGRIRAIDRETALYDLAWKRSVEASLEFANSAMPRALMFSNHQGLWDFSLSRVSASGLCAEFGVWKGRSINYFAEHLPMIYGFDSFAGLQEDWSGSEFARGTFDLKGRLPRVKPNVKLIKGWFQDTVPEFLAQASEPFAFVHIDCDTYEATSLVLNLLEKRLVPGTIMIFDEFFGYRCWDSGGEFKAWNEFIQRTRCEFEYLGFSSQQVAVQLTRVRNSEGSRRELNREQYTVAAVGGNGSEPSSR